MTAGVRVSPEIDAMRLAEFLEWWRAELAGMLPEALRRRWARRHETVRLTSLDGEVCISRRMNEIGRAHV